MNLVLALKYLSPDGVQHLEARTFEVPEGGHVVEASAHVDGLPLFITPFTAHGHYLRFDQVQGHEHELDDDVVED